MKTKIPSTLESKVTFKGFFRNDGAHKRTKYINLIIKCNIEWVVHSSLDMHVWTRWVYWIEIRIKDTVLLQVLLPDDRCTLLANKKQRHTNTTCNIPGPYKGLVILIIEINWIWFHVMSCRMQRFNWNRFVTGVNFVIGVVLLCVFGCVIAVAKSDTSPSVLFLHKM